MDTVIDMTRALAWPFSFTVAVIVFGADAKWICMAILTHMKEDK